MALQNADFGIGPLESAASDFPDTYSASARRCARLRSAARARIAPRSSDSSTCSALIRLITSRLGACGFAPGPFVAGGAVGFEQGFALAERGCRRGQGRREEGRANEAFSHE